MQKTAIVTGLTGQDGSIITAQLLDQGIQVFALVRRRSDSPFLGCAEDLRGRPGLEIVEGDITDLSSLTRLCKLASADYFYNLCAMSHVGTSFGQPILAAQTNAIGVLNCLEAIRGSGIHTRFYQACHDDKTLAVTPDGLRHFEDLRVGDLVFSVNEDTWRLELKRIKKVHVYQHDGRMVSLRGKRISQLVTPNHRVMLRNDVGGGVSVAADDLRDLFPYERISHLSLPFLRESATLASGPDDDVDLRDFVSFPELAKANNFYKNLIFSLPGREFFYLMGLYIGDGYKASRQKSTATPYSVQPQARDAATGRFCMGGRIRSGVERDMVSHTILFAIPESDPARDRLVSALTKCGYEFTEHKMTVNVTSLPLSKVFSLCGSSVYEKHIPAFAFEIRDSWACSLYDGIVDSDGHRREVVDGGAERHSVTTVSSKLVAGVIALIFRCGGYPSYRVRKQRTPIINEHGKRREIRSSTPAYDIDCTTRRENKLYKYMIDEVQYFGPVWCLEVEGNHNFLVARDGRVAFSGNSTSEMFGGLSGTPYSEEAEFHPRSPYGVAKLFGYWITRNYRESYKMFASNGILFNHECEGKRGPNFVTRKIAMAVAAIKAGKQNKLFLGNLDAKRDWGHASDFCVGVQMILNHNEPDDFVLATGETHSVREFCEIAFEVGGLGDYRQYVEVDPAFYRPAEVNVLIGDYSKAKRVLGWEPKIRFQELVRRMVLFELGELESAR